MVIRGLSASATVAVGAATAAAFGLNYGISRRRGRTQGLLQRKDSSAQNPSALSSSMLGISASVWKAWELVGPVVLAKEAENIVVSARRETSARSDVAESSEEPIDAHPKLMPNGDDKVEAHGAMEDRNDEEEKEEETTCAFCLFQRRGPCGQHFRSWEKCIARAKRDEVDFVSRCAPNTRSLMSCMDEHPDYYTMKDDAEESSEGTAGSEEGVSQDVLHP